MLAEQQTTSSLEFLVLRAMTASKELYSHIRPHIAPKAMAADCAALMKVVDSYYEQYQEDKEINLDVLYNVYLTTIAHTTAKKEAVARLIDHIRATELVTSEVLTDLVQYAADRTATFAIINEANKLANNSGGSFEEIQNILDTRVVTHGTQADDRFVFEKEAFRDQDVVYPFKLRLEALQAGIPGLSRGDFVGILARPETGKTAFATYLSAGFLQQGFKVAYFGNEEKVWKISTRHLSSLTGYTQAQVMIEDTTEAEKLMKENLYLYAAHGKPLKFVEETLDKVRPDVVILDILDHFPVKVQGEVRTDTLLEIKYNHARRIAAKYDCLVIGTGQASIKAEGKKWVSMEMAKDSTTGKGGSVDVMIGIGKTAQDDIHGTRGICVSKNKAHGTHFNVTVGFDPSTSRFETL